MKKLLLTVCTIGLFLSLPVKADKVSKVKEMLRLSNYNQTINALIKQKVLIPIECAYVVPSEKKGEISKELLNSLNLELLENSIVQFSADYYTEPELDEIIAFYKTPTGQKALKGSQELAGHVPQILQNWSQKMLSQLENFVEKMSNEYGQRSGSEIQSCIQSYQK